MGSLLMRGHNKKRPSALAKGRRANDAIVSAVINANNIMLEKG